MNKLENAELMKKLTIGVEIEMGEISKAKARDVVSKFFKSKGLECEKYLIGGCHNSHALKCPDGRVWQFMDDGSAPGTMGRISCEMVTPILKYDDIEDLQHIVRALRKAGAKSGNKWNAGVHIHIGGEGLDVKSLTNLINIMSSHEVLMYNAVRVSRGRNNWCKFVDTNLVESVNSRTNPPQTMEDMENLWYRDSNGGGWDRTRHYNQTRYHMMNLHSFFHGHGTIEFRLFEFKTELHAGELKSWIQLCMAIVSYTQLSKKCSFKKVKTDNEKHAMKCWLTNMGLIGDEFKTARKMLTKRLHGDTAYAHGRPNSIESIDDLTISFEE